VWFGAVQAVSTWTGTILVENVLAIVGIDRQQRPSLAASSVM
jgi:hypothetical protein